MSVPPNATLQRIVKLPPESARTPEGAKAARPPVTLAPLTVTAHRIDAAGLAFIEPFENIYEAVYCPYWDPYGNVWTRGFGETDWSGDFGGVCISHRQAELNLASQLASSYEWAIRDLNVQFDQHQWDALCDVVWNLGAGIFEGTALGADLRARNFGAAMDRLLEYDHAGGVELAGLRARREAEVRLFNEHEGPPPKPTHRQVLEGQVRIDRARVRNSIADEHHDSALIRRWEGMKARHQAPIKRLNEDIAIRRNDHRFLEAKVRRLDAQIHHDEREL